MSGFLVAYRDRKKHRWKRIVIYRGLYTHKIFITVGLKMHYVLFSPQYEHIKRASHTHKHRKNDSKNLTQSERNYCTGQNNHQVISFCICYKI